MSNQSHPLFGGEQTQITVLDLAKAKLASDCWPMLTTYDSLTAELFDEVGIPVLLVGDSAAMVMLGYDSTIPITVDELLVLVKAVSKSAKRAMVVADMPFGSYQASVEDALRNATRLVKEGGAAAVKVEGGARVAPQVTALVAAGIPVMGHLGLTPQSIYKFGTYSVRAKEEAEAQQLLNDAMMLEKAGCFAIVLEKIPAKLAEKVTQTLDIPIIGIGAGGEVDGQVLVVNDMLGMNKEFSPRFLRRYLDLNSDISKAVKAYTEDVKNQDFPKPEEQY